MGKMTCESGFGSRQDQSFSSSPPLQRHVESHVQNTGISWKQLQI